MLWQRAMEIILMTLVELEEMTGSFLGCWWEQIAGFSFSMFIKPTPSNCHMCYFAFIGTLAWFSNSKFTALQEHRETGPKNARSGFFTNSTRDC